MGVSMTSNHIQVKINIFNPNQEPPAPSKAPNEDLKDMDVLCTFKIKIESQNSEKCVYQRPVTISKSISGCQTPFRNLQRPPKPQMRTQRTWMFFTPSKSR